MPVYIYLFITYVKSTRGNTRMINLWPLCSACAFSHSGKTVEDPALHIGKTHRPAPVLCLAVARTETGLIGFEISLQFYTQIPKIRDEIFKAVRF